MKLMHKALLSLLLVLLYSPAQAIITGELIMVRSDKSFPEAMLILQDAIHQQGYKLSRVQRVDIGLTESGYQTDKYRIVFFGKTEEMHRLTEEHPELIPYLPLKIAIFAEAEETLLVTSDPATFMDLYPDLRLYKTFQQWHDDIVNIMKNVQIQD